LKRNKTRFELQQLRSKDLASNFPPPEPQLQTEIEIKSPEKPIDKQNKNEKNKQENTEKQQRRNLYLDWFGESSRCHHRSPYLDRAPTASCRHRKLQPPIDRRSQATRRGATDGHD
jgi:hypothetical protein